MRIHETAEIHGAVIGEGTSVWQHCVILAGATIGRDCNVNAHCLIEGQAIIGDRVTLKCGVYVWDGVELADDVFVGPNVSFTNDRSPRSRQRPVRYARTRVGRGASLGAGSVLVAPVHVGEYALIGAAAVVTHDVPPYAVVVGNPARQTGWICACGSHLVAPWACPACGRTFSLSAGQLRPIEAERHDSIP